MIDGDSDHSAAALRLVEALAGVGHWRYVLATEQVFWSDEVFRIHGLEPRSIAPDFPSVVAAYHADDQAVLVVASGGHRVDTAKVAAILGVSEVGKATADDVRAATSFAIGGVAPIGHPAPLRTIVDVDLSNFDEVWAAGGHPHYVFPTSFDELVRITGGTPADVGA